MQFAGTFGEQGVRYTLKVPAQDLDVLSRQVIAQKHEAWNLALWSMCDPARVPHACCVPDPLSCPVVVTFRMHAGSEVRLCNSLHT